MSVCQAFRMAEGKTTTSIPYSGEKDSEEQ
jgi:hypothetical protein